MESQSIPFRSIPEPSCPECREDTASVESGYRPPIKAIQEALDRLRPPLVLISPSREHLMLLRACRYPPIAELARPRLCLAGLRIDPRTSGEFSTVRFTSLSLKRIADASEVHVLLPHNARIGCPQWSPNGERFAFTNAVEDRIELWVGHAATGQVHKVEGVRLNGVHGAPFTWMPDNKALLVHLVPTHRGEPPVRPAIPKGPRVLEADGQGVSSLSHVNVLRDSHDEDLFDYYAMSQLAIVDLLDGKTTSFGKPSIFSLVEPSPDGQHFIVVSIERPYSYLHPSSSFPRQVEVWNRHAHLLFKLASRPLADRVPLDGVPIGPREYRWQPTDAATLVWVEALDDGDPKTEAAYRDRVVTLSVPFTGSPSEMIRTKHRFSSIRWAEDQTFTLVDDYDRDARWRSTYLVGLNGSSPRPPRVIWSRNIQDRYNSPGMAMSRLLPSGHAVLVQRGDWIYLSGDGASSVGDYPFLNRFNVRTLETEQLFRSPRDAHEAVVALVDSEANQFITCRESPAESPNYYLREGKFDDKNRRATKKRHAGRRSSKASKTTPLTCFSDPWPYAQEIHKELVRYKREDGVRLSMMVHLPPGYRRGQRLPTLLWSYPHDYSSQRHAEQTRSSTNRFTSLRGIHLLLLLSGYAVLENASMPIIGQSGSANDTFAEQLAMNARAAIDKAAAIGVTDRRRIAVGGHSYGATMAAVLLAHTELFQAGVALSGAYNRTLTPFGFQTERRTLWEAPEIYTQMSPLMSAHRIAAPLLLIHGESDENPGTLPIQSERMYQAIRGNGGKARLVMLPHEGHCYSGRESVGHALWEITSWLNKHLTLQ